MVDVGCPAGGRFTVREASYQATGAVNRFWAAFDLRCAGTGPATSGDLRLTGVGTGNPPFAMTCMVP
ncbi:MAG TPA: hypothetical protein VGJ78_05930 [Vicinamibacterales bacterium]